jgi:hypothetical protein
MNRQSCNADEGRCTANDGEPCDDCVRELAALADYYRAEYNAASTLERLAVTRGVQVEELEEFKDEMRDAGRARWAHD